MDEELEKHKHYLQKLLDMRAIDFDKETDDALRYAIATLEEVSGDMR